MACSALSFIQSCWPLLHPPELQRKRPARSFTASTQNTPMLLTGYLPTAKLAGACTSAKRAVLALGRIDTHGAAPLSREHQAFNPATGYTLPLNPVAGRQNNTHVASLRFTAAHWRWCLLKRPISPYIEPPRPG